MASGSSRDDSNTTRCIQEVNGSTVRQSRLNRYSYELRRRRLTERLCTRIREAIQRNHCFIKDIIPSSGLQEAQRIVQSYNYYPESQKTATFIIGFHPKEKESQQHIHFYHICSYNQSNCRCTYLRGFQFKRRRHTDIIRQGPIETKHIQAIIEYLLENPRQLVHIQIGTDSFIEEIHRLENLRSSFYSGRDSTERPMEMCEFSLQDGDRSLGFNNEPDDFEEVRGIERFINQGLEQIPWIGQTTNTALRKQRLNHYLICHLLKYLVTPIEKAADTEEWLDNPNLAIYDASNPDYKLAVNSVYRLTCNLDFNQIYNIHNTPGCLGIYSARNNDHYFSIDESIEHIEQLLIHQYGRDNVPGFILRLYQICEKIIPKKNSMFIYGKFSQVYFNRQGEIAFY